MNNPYQVQETTLMKMDREHKEATNVLYETIDSRDKEIEELKAHVERFRTTLGSISGATRNATVADLVRWADRALKEIKDAI
jgi:hypothetical protein